MLIKQFNAVQRILTLLPPVLLFRRWHEIAGMERDWQWCGNKDSLVSAAQADLLAEGFTALVAT